MAIIKNKHQKTNGEPTKELTDKQQAKEDRRRLKAASTIIDLIPIRELDKTYNCFVRDDGSCIDFIQIIAKDLSNAGKDVTDYDEMLWEKLYKTYKGDFKLLFMDYPVDTAVQIRYFKNRLKQTINPIFFGYLKEKLAELEYLSKHRNNREFYLMTFSANVTENHKNVNQILSTLDGLSYSISPDKKIRILEKLNNKSIQSFEVKN